MRIMILSLIRNDNRKQLLTMTLIEKGRYATSLRWHDAKLATADYSVMRMKISINSCCIFYNYNTTVSPTMPPT